MRSFRTPRRPQMTMQTATTTTPTPMPRLIRDVDEARHELTRRRGFEEPDLSPRMREGIRRVFGADLRRMRWSTASSRTCAARETRRSCATPPRSTARPRSNWRSRAPHGKPRSSDSIPRCKMRSTWPRTKSPRFTVSSCAPRGSTTATKVRWGRWYVRSSASASTPRVGPPSIHRRC